ncbi:MAG: hypothetical protein MI747_25505 [Desulfobacterales bacterium]|nr:hypothetical protein [Desulfobacterales bacterium]
MVCIVWAGLGCRPVSLPETPTQRNQKIHGLIEATLSSLGSRGLAATPFGLVPGSALQNNPIPRLEEQLLTQLRARLSQSHEYIALSRAQWNTLVLGRPLSAKGRGKMRGALIENITLFVARVQWDPVSHGVDLQIQALDARGRHLPGVGGRSSVALGPNHDLLRSNGTSAFIPRGSRGNPYDSLAELARGVALEWGEQTVSKIMDRDAGVDPREIQAMICPVGPVFPGRDFMGALQQALVGISGMDFVLGPGDLPGVVVGQDFQAGYFDTDFEPFVSPPLLLLVQLRQADRDIHHLTLRSVWQESPLVDAHGGLIPHDRAGRYVTGAVAGAWFRGKPGEDGAKGDWKGLLDRGFD